MDLRTFFTPLVEEVRSPVTPEARVYVVGVLVSAPLTLEPLGPKIYAETSPIVLRILGDEALFLSGYFPERLERIGIPPGYYAALGSLAYGRCSRLDPVFGELSARFPDCQDLVRDVRERCDTMGMDMWSALDRWLQTGSRALGRRLQELGMTPLVGRS
jgi:hypothetical protein